MDIQTTAEIPVIIEPDVNNRKKKWILAIIGLAILTAIVIILSQTTRGRTDVGDELTPTVSPTETPVITATPTPSTTTLSWKQYEGTELGVNFSYPADYSVTKAQGPFASDNNDWYYKISSPDGYMEITILRGYASWVKQNTTTKKETYGSITVAPLTYKINGKSYTSRYNYDAEGSPCTDNSSNSSLGSNTSQYWEIDKKITIDYQLSANQDCSKIYHQASDIEKDIAKQIIESIKLTSAAKVYVPTPTATETPTASVTPTDTSKADQWVIPVGATATGYDVWVNADNTGSPTLAIDGVYTTSWTINSLGSITFDLGETKTIKSIDILGAGSVSSGNYANVYVDSTQVLSHTLFSPYSSGGKTISPTDGRYIKYELLDTPGSTWGGISEIRVLVETK